MMDSHSTDQQTTRAIARPLAETSSTPETPLQGNAPPASGAAGPLVAPVYVAPSEANLLGTPAVQASSDGTAAAQEPQGPAPWLIVSAAGALIVLAAVLVFWPGATLLDRLRALDGGICAQLPTHSFYPGGERLPLCARNTGIYLGFAITTIILFIAGRGRAMNLPRWPVALVLLACVVVLGVDGFNSLFLDLHLPHLYQPHNLIRLTTGLFTGMAMASFLLPVTNSILWKDLNEQRSMASWWQVLQIVPILAICFLAVGTQAALFLYPVAILSSLGVMTALSLINLTLMVAISGKICTFQRPRQVFPFVSLAYVLATGELMGLFFLSHWLLQQVAV
jgi:uncharacterized membrane protein